VWTTLANPGNRIAAVRWTFEGAALSTGRMDRGTIVEAVSDVNSGLVPDLPKVRRAAVPFLV